MHKEDHLSNEVSLDVSISEKGVSGKAKLRSLSALDRLVGSFLDIPTAKLETFANQIRAKDSRKIKEIVSKLISSENLLENEDELARAIVENHLLPKQIQQISNKLKIVENAIEHLSEVNEDVSSTNEEIEDDWLNYFEQYAEKASSERMQKLWARVLAGEIRKPNSFSLTTLRFLSELDKDIASLFEKEVMYRIQGSYNLKPEKNELINQRLFDLTFLEEVGLLQNVTAGIERTRKPNQEGIVIWEEGNYMLLAGTERDVKLSLIPLTRIGREIASILPPAEPLKVLERIGKHIDGQVKFLELHLILSNHSNNITSKYIKTIKSK